MCVISAVDLYTKLLGSYIVSSGVDEQLCMYIVTFVCTSVGRTRTRRSYGSYTL